MLPSIAKQQPKLEVQVVADCVSFRFMTDCMYSLNRMRDSDACLRTSKFIIFVLDGDRAHSHVKSSGEASDGAYKGCWIAPHEHAVTS